MGNPMDQSSIVGFVLAYLLTLLAVCLLLLPGVILYTVLLLVAGAIRLVMFLLGALQGAGQVLSRSRGLRTSSGPRTSHGLAPR